MATRVEAGSKSGKETASPRPVVWFEVVGTDVSALRQFYSRLFDWQVTDSGTGYGLVAPGEKGIGGGIGKSKDGSAGLVTFYVEVDDPAAYLKRAEALGGKTIVPPTEIPQFNLTFAWFADPEGHVIGLSRGAVR